MIFLKRAMKEDEKRLEQAFSFLKQSKMPVWLINYPEGHRFSQHYRKQSQDFSLERGLPLMEHVRVGEWWWWWWWWW